MKKLFLLTLICFVLVGIGNVFSHSLADFSETHQAQDSEWAMFKELFQ